MLELVNEEDGYRSMPNGETGEPFIGSIPFQVLSWKPRALYFPKFATPKQCETIIKMAKANLKPSALALRKGETTENTKGTRTSSGTFVSASEDTTGTLALVEEKIARATMIPRAHGEAFNVLRYEVGQKYDSHYDAFNPSEYGPQNSQRIASFLLYLSNVEEGGETMFPLENDLAISKGFDYKRCTSLKVKPQQGDGLLFYSTFPNGTIDPTSLHGSCPVIKGEKWVATKWIRDQQEKPHTNTNEEFIVCVLILFLGELILMAGPLRLFSLCLLVFVTLRSSVSSNSEGDALHKLRTRLSDPNNVLQSWDPTLVNPCTWFHVTCDSNNHVIRLDLGNSNISGTLGPELGKLKHLQYLELYKNDVRGKIPKELGNLKDLISMDLYGNKLEGQIPKSFANLKSLRFLRLNDNKLTGPIPKELTRLSNLKIFDVSNNDLCGTIPIDGPFGSFPMESFDKNRLNGPELVGLVPYDFEC